MDICDSLHLGWEQLAKHGEERLSTILGRKIDAGSEQYDYFNWTLRVDLTPLTKDEIKLLFDAVNASDHDRDSNDFDDNPISELNQGLAEKVILPLLPFKLDKSMADNDGVWFFGPTYPRHFDPSIETSEVEDDGVGITRCARCNTMIVCDGNGDMPTICPGCTRKLAYNAYKPQTDTPVCVCGNSEFNAHQVCHHDIVTDGKGNFRLERSIYHSNPPFGPFTCTCCGTEYEELSDIARGINP